MRNIILIYIIMLTTLFGIDNIPQDAPETPGIQMQKLDEIDKSVTTKKDKKAIIDDLEVDEKVKGVGENRIKGPSFILQNVSITGNTILNQQEIIDIVQPLVGTNVDSIDLKSISEKITKLYTEKGYVTSKCIIPAQKVKGGNVKFQIIEDKLANIILKGEDSYNYDTNIFMKHLYMLRGKVIKAQELDEKLQLLSNLPVTKIKPSLQKTAQGFTSLVLEITDTKERFSISTDNSGSKYTGEQRFTLNGNINNIRGKSDSLSLSLTTAQNTENLTSFSSSYITPFGIHGGRLSFGYNHMYYQLDPDIVGNELVRYEGETDVLSTTYSQPITLNDTSKLSFNIGIEKKNVSSKTIENKNGFIVIDGQDDTFVLSSNINYLKTDKLFGDKYIGVNFIDFGVKKALAGFWDSMTDEDLERKQYKFDDNTSGYMVTKTLDGPIKFGDGLNPAFLKFYYSFQRQQRFIGESIISLKFSGDYTQDRVPDSYEYSGGDFGYNYSLSLDKRLWEINTKLSISQSKIYTYNTNMTKEAEENDASYTLSANTTYEDLYMSLSYSSSFDKWDSNTNSLRYNIKYSW